MSDIPSPPSVSDIADDYIRSQRAELPGLRTGQGQLARADAETTALVVAGIHVEIADTRKQLSPLTADSEAGLSRWADLLGVPRHPASPVRKASAVQFRGQPGAVIPLGAELSHASGPRYRATRAVTLLSDGRATTDIESIDTGPDTRLSAGEALTVTSPPTGVVKTARITRDLDEGGLAAEELGDWARRIQLRYRERLKGGSRTDYQQWAEAVPLVHRAYVYPGRPGRGYVSVAVLKQGRGAVRACSAAERAEVWAALDAQRPTTHQVHVVETVTRPVLGNITLSLRPGFALDWTGSLTVHAWDPDKARLFYLGNPLDLTIGDMVTVAALSPASRETATGRPAMVTALGDDGGVAYMDLAPVEGSDPLAGHSPVQFDPIRPSSALHYDIWRAVVTHVDTLGPANPGGAYGDWTADIRVMDLQALLAAYPGVLAADITIDSEDDDAEAAASEDWQGGDVVLTTELLIAGEWVVQ